MNTEKMNTINNLNSKIDVALSQLQRVIADVAKIDDKLEREYITRGEVDARISRVYSDFSPTQKIVLGFVTMALVAVVTGLLSLVIKR